MILYRYITERIGKGFIGVLAVLILASCSTTRFVPEDKYLLNKVELEVDNPEINKDEAKSFIRQKENYKILGFVKFYLILYNMSSKKKTDDWLKRIGEAPQLYDEVMTDRSKEQLKQYLDNKGYYRADITSGLDLKDKKKKAKLTFNIETGERYTINDVRYHFATPKLEEIFKKDSMSLQFKRGVPFDIYDLQKQQERIVKLYRDKGYFYFSKNQVRYKADTTQLEKRVALDLYIGETRNSQVDSTKILRPYYFNNFYYSIIPGTAPNLSQGKAANVFADTLEWDNARLFLAPSIYYPANLFRRTTQMQSGDLYNATDVENTFNALNRLRQFRYVDIQFEEAADNPYSNLLDCNVRLSPLSKQSISLDLEGTNTSGNLGVAGNIYYQHRNLFRGAEVFQIRLKGAVERMQRQVDNGSESFNTREFGIENSLNIPKLLGPGKFIRSFEKNLPKTVLNMGFNYQRRPEYTRTITNLRFGYDWKTSQNFSHLWNLMDVNFVHLFEFDQAFIDSIQDLYIKSSFTDHFIFATNYSLVYNNQHLGVKSNYTYARLNVESAGNSLWALSKITGRSKYQDPNYENSLIEYYRYLGTPFAQYLKADIEVRRAIEIDQYNSIVGRAFFGIGFPYGNSGLLPFEKQYFAGGANGIRAWQVRSLGPGNYKAPDGFYPNQSSDLKIEANLEYRYNLIGRMEGALFLDAGNIWAINKYYKREGVRFHINEFYKQIAVGTGTGFRFNLNYFILRFDLGMKLRDPSAEAGKRWIIGTRKLTGDDFNLNFAIGYPF
ncbi:BamA/TamA family outer membrane protein [Maribellus luteus]|uniref:translocation and assembly module lipoprotein TamL n=1 Tax=Maribellus luteus TaxID=2305463 RepID=UPI0018811B5B|nr:BamA/TamA family outer membrane protein [Maribellus luteus]